MEDNKQLNEEQNGTDKVIENVSGSVETKDEIKKEVAEDTTVSETKMYTNIPVEDLQKLQSDAERVRVEISKMLIGQSELIDLLLVSLFTGGHVLLEGVPGIAKTLAAKLIAKSIDTGFSRVQFTPDLMPADVIGSAVFNMKTSSFDFQKGPVFSNIVLIDEINRAPAKTQAALIEVMEEKQVTIDGITHKMDQPFFIVATQNPIEQEGTYQLPEAQLDRFMFNIWVDYPSFEEELEVVKTTTNDETPSIESVLNAEEITYFQHLVKRVPVADNVLRYAVTLTAKTRPQGEHATDVVKQYVSWGAGPRASQYLILGAKTHALINGKFAPDIEDVQAVALPILRHRIVPNYKAEAEGYNVTRIIKSLL